MKKEELFEGAIVLARPTSIGKRSRCRVVEVQAKALPDLEVSLVRDTKGKFFAMRHDIQPAKITPKALRECGFEDPIFRNCKGKCFLYTGTKVHLLLKDSACGNKTGKADIRKNCVSTKQQIEGWQK